MAIDEFFGGLNRNVRHAAGLLIKRGTAMGPLVPTLPLVPVLLFFAWLLESSPLVQGILVLCAIGIPVAYFTHYGRFAKNDPDRLQSEDFRVEMSKIHMLTGKEFPRAILADEIQLGPPTANPALEPIPHRPSTTGGSEAHGGVAER